MVCVGGAVLLEVSSAKQRPESCIEAIMRERPNIVTKLGGNSEFVLQDHNWMSHALPTAQDLLNAEGLKTQKWPTIAHDLNIMENVWGWLIREVFDGGRKFSRKDDLIFRIKEAWSHLPLDLITNLYSTLPERITELYYTQGVYTNCWHRRPEQPGCGQGLEHLTAMAVVQADNDRVPEPDSRRRRSSASVRGQRAKEENLYIQFNLTFCV